MNRSHRRRKARRALALLFLLLIAVFSAAIQLGYTPLSVADLLRVLAGVGSKRENLKRRGSDRSDRWWTPSPTRRFFPASARPPKET